MPGTIPSVRWRLSSSVVERPFPDTGRILGRASFLRSFLAVFYRADEYMHLDFKGAITDENIL